MTDFIESQKNSLTQEITTSQAQSSKESTFPEASLAAFLISAKEHCQELLDRFKNSQ